MNLGFGEIALIVIVALLIFGPAKLPQLGKAAGQTLHEFKKGMKGILDDEEEGKEKENAVVKDENSR
ncbi:MULTISPECIES: twin-arginine translocase TatA/TatE family subunit [Bacillus]|jgi:sec-independent protein translocase protein TatA|uniref:twin-arginine translocase TatA/TatE family subunit n=1 Tax=Bacillus TaxID=1386 RepID=UPI00065E01FB|nr:twin-arginine translocase TatA/TatE family subunit [Bacillus smithii]AKP46259.1 Twin-arginine translocation protein TatA [Bacillus smithii]MED1421132.1 twin-arginine translocase TatA/TatE family subunit [Bacillus smithii]MED1457005.1 twin-arginine translocase TatA/TatE family subunit [Bacillus smithii]MED4884502.1 twin-arginine translocase TatA/TatE family subunit [Bacillus smithii]MED4926337.1 twin-arginine translocase TatA/TatE family subunit [Bacillus smithii]